MRSRCLSPRWGSLPFSEPIPSSPKRQEEAGGGWVRFSLRVPLLLTCLQVAQGGAQAEVGRLWRRGQGTRLDSPAPSPLPEALGVQRGRMS